MDEWPNCLSDTAVQLARESAHSASFCASSYFYFSGFRLAQRSALWILLWGLGSFTTLEVFTKGMATRHICTLASIMELKKLIRISNFIYPLTLILAIPFYLVLYGASGHRFNIPNEDIFWICVVCSAILTFYINRRTNKLISKILTAAFATIILYGSVQITWSQLNFTFGDDIGILVVFLLMSCPLVFLAATGIYIYSLFLRTT